MGITKMGMAAIAAVTALAFSGAGSTSSTVKEASSLASAIGADTSEGIPLDITGDAASLQERDRLQSLLSSLDEVSGGLIWNGDRQVLKIQMTTSAALDEAQAIVERADTDLSVEYAQVTYSQRELDSLAIELLNSQEEWAGQSGIGGDLILQRTPSGFRLMPHTRTPIS